MANSTFRPKVLGKRGGTVLNRAMRSQSIIHPETPKLWWEAEVTRLHLNSSTGVQQVNTITIPAAGFVAGRMTLTFTGGGLSSPVAVTADAAAGDANTDLATAMEAAIETARAGDLIGVVLNETVASNVITVTFVEGVGLCDVDVAFDPAQVIDVQFSGTIPADGDISLEFTGGGLGAAVTVTTEIVSSVPANIAALIIDVEADVEAAAGLSGVVVSADDDASDTNTVQMAEALADVTITDVSVIPQTIDCLFAGTATDGDYDLVFSHSSLPGPVTARVTRATTPATHADLAAAMATEVEALVAIEHLIDDALSAVSGDTYTVATKPGVTGLSITAAAPAPGTLTPTETTLTTTISDATPAGPTITNTQELVVTLNSLFPRNAFPADVVRMDCPYIYVHEAWPSGTRVEMGDAADDDALVTSSVISSTGFYNTVGAAEYAERYEAAYEPTITLRITDLSALPSAGKLWVAIAFKPLGEV